MNWDQLSVAEQRRVQNAKLHRFLNEVIAPFILQHVLDDTPDIAEWQIELRKANNDPLDVDEMVLDLATTNGINPEDLQDRIRHQFQTEAELTPNRIEIHPVEEMIKRIKLKTSLKEVHVLDSRPKG